MTTGRRSANSFFLQTVRLLLLLPLLAAPTACSAHDPAVSVGVGTHGAGVGVHTNGPAAPYGGLGFGSSFSGRSYGGVLFGLPLSTEPGSPPDEEAPQTAPDGTDGWRTQY